MEGSLLDRALIYVTGKGGVGKTTVAASIGLAAAARGKRTIVCEVADQAHMSRAFAHAGVSREREVALADGLFAITLDPEHALEEWLSGQLGGSALRVLTRSHAFQYFVAAAPGARELITIAKVYEIAQLERWTAGNRSYDLVVLDAPASGHGLGMLTTPSTFGDIARVGTVRRQAHKVRDMLRDPARTAYVAVAIPEEMPVNETLELQDRLVEAVGVELGAIIVNELLHERFSRPEVERLEAVAADAGDGAGAVRAALAADARAHSQRTHLRRLRRGARAPVITLPYLFTPELGLDEYGELARLLGRKL